LCSKFILPSGMNGETDEMLTFYVNRFDIMAKNLSKLVEYNEANTHHIFFGETIDPKHRNSFFFQPNFQLKVKSGENILLKKTVLIFRIQSSKIYL